MLRVENRQWKGIGCMRHLDLRRTWGASRRNRMLIALLNLALAATASTARAQTTPGTPPQSSKGTIRGVVTLLGQQTESSPLEGVRVELTEDSQGSRPAATLTDSSGHYEFAQLHAGAYTIRVNQQGFKPFAEAISLNPNETSVLDIALSLDTVVDKVEVKEQAPTISTNNSSPASAVNNTQLETLPLAQQKFREALPLVPGVIRTLDGKLSVRGTEKQTL